jgi:predicted RecA/RadA family phage recombinase
MDNFVAPGESIDFVAPSGGLTTGTPKQIGQVVVVPGITGAENAIVPCMIRGVFRVTKVGSQAWTQGAIVYWDAGNSRFTTVGPGNLRAGFAVLGLAAAMPGSGAGETTGYVMLTGSAEESGT